MKNKLLSFLMLFVASVWSLSMVAQTAGETYYLYNASSGLFLSHGDSWGTRATADKLGDAYNFVSNGSGYSLKNVVISAVKNGTFYLGSNLFADNGTAQSWIFTASGTNGYTISDGTNYLLISDANTNAQRQINTTTTATDAAVWKLLTISEYATFQDSVKDVQAAAAATSMGLTGITTYSNLVSTVTSVTEFKSTDKSSSISNYDFSSAITTGWTVSSFNTNRLGDRGISSGNYQCWNGAVKISQTLTGLPQGIYKLQVQAYYRFGNTAPAGRVKTAGESMLAYLYAGDNYVPLKSWSVDASGSDPNSQAAAATYFSNGKYWNEIYAYVGADGNLPIGIYQAGYVDNCWLVMDNFKLTYYTNSITAEEVTALETTIPTGKMNSNVETTLGTAKATLDATPTIANYNALSTAITNANASIAVYTNVNAAIASAQANAATLDAVGQAVFDISTTITAYDDGTITDGVAELAAIQSALWVAVKSQTTPDSSMTLALVNPTMTEGTTGWTTTFGSQTATYTNFTGQFLEKWAYNAALSDVSCYQTILGMPNGVYELKAACLGTRQDNADPKGYTTGVYLYINDSTTAVATGNGTPEYFTLQATVSDGSITIGFKTESTTANWVAWDNVSLTYKGTVGDALLQDVLDAKSSLETYETIIPSGVYASFAAHIASAGSASSTDAVTALQAILDNLNDDIATAAALTVNYQKLINLIAACKVNRDNSTADDGLAVGGGGTLNTFASAIAAASIGYDDATSTAATLGDAYTTLEAAREAYVVVAIPADGYPFDFTFKVTNPSFETGDITGWAVSGTSGDQGAKLNSNSVYTINPVDGNYLFNSWVSDTESYTLSQTVTALPQGTYSLSVYVASFEGKTVTIYAGDSIDALVTTGGKGVSHTATIAGFPVNDGSVTIGVKAGVFYKADNFILSYTGFDSASAASAVTALAAYIAEADSILLPANNIYIGSPQTLALSAANSAAKLITVSSTGGQIKTAVTNIEAAIKDALTSQASYQALKALLDKVTATMPTFSGLSDAQDVYDNQSDTPAVVDAATETLRSTFTSYPTDNNDYSTPADMSNYYLVNGDFSDGTNGWSKTGSFTASHTWTVSDNVLTFAPASGHYTGCTTWQSVKLAAGSYKLSADVNAGYLEGKTTCLFAATNAPAWNNILSGVLGSTDVTNYGSYETLSVVFTLATDLTVVLGVNSYAYNTATAASASYSVKNFKLEQAKNAIATNNGISTATGTWTAGEIAAIPITSAITALDLTGITIPSGTTVNVTSNSNCLIKAADASNLSNTTNVIVGTTCASFVLTDGYDFTCPFDFTATTATYNNRKLYTDGGWQTFYAPIATPAQTGYIYETFNVMGTSATYASFTDVTSTVATEGLKAYTPYLMKKSEASGTFESVNITGTAGQSIAVEGTQSIEFRGTTTKITITDSNKGNYYVMNGDGTCFQKAGTGATIPAYRAYLYLDAGPSSIRIHHADVTGINPAIVDVDAATNVYSIDGRLLRRNVKAGEATTGLAKGIYVVNGKKIIVK